MFRFANPDFLYLFFLLPVLVGVYLFYNHRRRQNIRKYGDPALLKELMPTISKYRPDVKFWLTISALALCIFMLARPQFGSKMETVKRSGVETVIALDISNSMLAEDVTPSRLEKAKKLISRLVDTFNNDKVGMIVFAGEAFTQLPITSDYVSAKMFLESINPNLISTQGTDIGAAIRLGMKSFTPKEGVGRAIIVITDGENHEGGALEAAKEAAELEKKRKAECEELIKQADDLKNEKKFKDALKKLKAARDMKIEEKMEAINLLEEEVKKLKDENSFGSKFGKMLSNLLDED